MRTSLRPERYSRQQIRVVLKKYKNDIEQLKTALAQLTSQGLSIQSGLPFEESLVIFRSHMMDLKKTHQLSKSSLLEDFEQLKKVFKKIPGEEASAERFADLLNKQSWEAEDFNTLLSDGLIWVEKCHPDNRRKKSSFALNLHYPHLSAILNKKLEPLIRQGGDPTEILARLASDCQIHMKKFLQEEELMGFDDLLKAMWEATASPNFNERVRKCYKAALIDEFQDTDPIQWDIFRRLFLENEGEWGHLYLVGDPKQSIYSFRQADIYTYLSAAEVLGPDSRGYLDTNFRSQPELVKALNSLFDPSFSAGLMKLPRHHSTLSFESVKAGSKALLNPGEDGQGSLHFFYAKNEKKGDAEKKYFLPFIVQEILHLMKQGFHPKQMALLVKDRHQAERLKENLMKWNIPAINQRHIPLAASFAVEAYRELLQASLNPRHQSSLKTALGGPILGWTHEQVILLRDPFFLEKILLKFFELRNTLFQFGIGAFFQQLMGFSFLEEAPLVSARLLSSEGGEDLYQDLLHLTELMAQEESRTNLSPEGLITYLNDLKKDSDEENGVMRRCNPDLDAVQILTIHKSKGLEFDVVFALGLIGRSPEPQTLIPLPDPEGYFSLQVRSTESPDYLAHCEEVDAEKMRQLYVALTRAKLRLYVPAQFEIDPKPIKFGTASPMELFTAILGQPEMDYEQQYARIANGSAANFKAILDPLGEKANITSVFLNETPLSLERYRQEQTIHLIEPKQVLIPGQTEFMFSYTALSKSIKKQDLPFEQLPPHNFFSEIKNPHTLPSGSDTGILLHGLLENIDFNLIADCRSIQEMIPLISPYLFLGRFMEWKEAIASILFHCLHVLLPLQGEKSALCALGSSMMYKEIEFLYPWTIPFNLPEIEQRPGFLKGVIDLIFAYNGKYYLLDWKSNWLGPSRQDYNQMSMEKAMEESHYFLQAALYKEALRRYLHLFDSRPFDEIYGGTFYIFMRGVEASSNENTGIYYLR